MHLIRSSLQEQLAQLRDTGIESWALGTGAALPSVTLPDAMGRPMSLQTLNRDGPLVIVCYRGGWCPYCSLELREWQRPLPELRRHGAMLVAICNGPWMLPLPATYLIDRSGVVAYAHVEVAYLKRAEPQDVLDRLRDGATPC